MIEILGDKYSLKYSLTSILYLSTMAYMSQILLLVPDFFIDDYRLMDNIKIPFLNINTTVSETGKSPVYQLTVIILSLATISLLGTYFFLKAIEQEDRDYFNKLYE